MSKDNTSGRGLVPSLAKILARIHITNYFSIQDYGIPIWLL
ncbi:hypothetical protein Hsw_3469 [Hymenobacter swuensis DY53]|uniref:Uncharacterized protein n=1 Tax=Hymenobacter swuensis DY53 TaxID=1227739 RepID=W8F103_9BACT|nr:hypothetical protein Hsw_3469 [Hymenobacter swuensis DY53]